MSVEDGDSLSPQEVRLEGYLGELREDPPRSESSLVVRVARHARWQRAVRGPLRTVGILASAVLDGLGVIVGFDGRHRP